jgi:hypothetical protein
MESKALALGKQVKAEALNSNVHLINHAIISQGGLTKLFFVCSITR